jgi:DNA-binding SARP family transcriptional activator
MSDPVQMLQFNILGPLAVQASTGPVPLTTMRRSLLAVLLCEPNTPWYVTELAEQLWPGQVTGVLRRRIHIHVHRLRAALGDPARIARRGNGYAAVVHRGELDLDRFTGLVENARFLRDSGDRGAAGDLLAQALAVWRGAAFADIELGPLVLPHAARLNELRLTVEEELISLELAILGNDPRLDQHDEWSVEPRALSVL